MSNSSSGAPPARRTYGNWRRARGFGIGTLSPTETKVVFTALVVPALVTIKTAADGSSCPSPVQPMRTTPGSGLGGEEPPRQKIARLEARVRELEISEKKLTAEREILQRAAKYFAGETRW